MKRVEPRHDWPQSWKNSYAYDQEEIYGEISNRGYAYAYENRRRQTLRLLTEAVPPGGRVLDMAAAQGNFSLALAEMGYEVTWNDLRVELADYVRLKYERGQIHFAPGNAFDLQFPSLFDAVLITEVIEHVAHPDQFLAKTAALIKPGGHVIMTTPNGAYFKNSLPKFFDCADPSIYEFAQFRPDAEGHIFLLHPEEIRRLADRAGLQVDLIKLLTNPLTAGHMKTEALLRILPRRAIDLFEIGTESLPYFLKRRALVQMAVRFRKPANS
jgi:2-polyprenyl-3-methyl-5-hydroxy-6-metoxy-1,4-benzoquinol methylase